MLAGADHLFGLTSRSSRLANERYQAVKLTTPLPARKGGPEDPGMSPFTNDFERIDAPERRLWPPAWTPRIAEDREGYRAMLVIESAANRSDCQGYFDGSLELLRELAVTSDVDAALPRLSSIVSKMLPHDALRMACFDQRWRPIVNASTADVPDMTASWPGNVRELRNVLERAAIPCEGGLIDANNLALQSGARHSATTPPI